MAKIKEIAKFLDTLLKIKSIKDDSQNGLQVKCNNEVKKIGFSVDCALSTFEKAKDLGVDLLIVHHGLKWKPQKRKLIAKKREIFLKKNKISLYGCHLPLDAHEKYGNNIGLIHFFNCEKIKKFAKYHGKALGYVGILKEPVSLSQITEIMDKNLNTKSKILAFNSNLIKKIGIVSGGGGASIEEAFEEKLDCFITGEIKLSEYHFLRDLKLNAIISGHYDTETVGVKLLMPLLKAKFSVETVFIENKPEDY